MCTCLGDSATFPVGVKKCRLPVPFGQWIRFVLVTQLIPLFCVSVWYGYPKSPYKKAKPYPTSHLAIALYALTGSALFTQQFPGEQTVEP